MDRNENERPRTRLETILLAATATAALAWLLTHDGCAHPLGNTIALIAYVSAATTLLLPWALRKLAPYLTQDTDEERREH